MAFNTNFVEATQSEYPLPRLSEQKKEVANKVFEALISTDLNIKEATGILDFCKQGLMLFPMHMAELSKED